MLLEFHFSFNKPMKVYSKIGLSLLVVMCTVFTPLSGQVLRPFSPKSSANSPSRSIYNINGDFTMLGNTNLTLENYSLDLQNNMPMIYVDVDDDPTTFNSSSASLEFSTENNADPSCTNILFAGLYWSGRSYAEQSFEVEKDGITKIFHKQEIKIKGPGQTEYVQLRASPNDIWYPKTMDEQYGMFAGFVEITDYVKSSGSGSYTVADIAISEGQGGPVGFYGGWGMVVVYENHLMKQRDVVVFDGFAFVASFLDEEYFLTLGGFSAMEAGNVNLKMGIMAGEGDRGGLGDYFEIERGVLTNDFLRLSHPQNQPNNFFNATINTGGNDRNPLLENNTGIDIAMFTIPNIGNSVIGNGQTSTRFRYGSTIDTYAVFNITFAIDADRPLVEGLHQLVSEHDFEDDVFLVSPGDELKFTLEIRNKGNEGITAGKVVIPIPLSVTSEVATMEAFFSPNNVNQPYYDGNLGAGGSLVWEIGDLPVSQDPEFLLAKLEYTLKVVESCAAFSGFSCNPTVSIAGEISGINRQTEAPFSGIKIIQGYLNSTACSSSPIVEPYRFLLDPAELSNEDCTDEETKQVFEFCNYEPPFLPIEEIADAFPPETRFFNEFPITFTSIEYTARNPIPVVDGFTEYFAVLRGENDCFQKFAINHEPITITASVTSDYTGAAISCFGAANASVSVEIIGSNPPYSILWDDENKSSTAMLENLGPGTYNVTVTNSKGCQVSTQVTVDEPELLVLNPTLGMSTLAVSCFGLSDGVYAIDVAGGVLPFTGDLFQLDEGGNSSLITTVTIQDSRELVFNGLSPGTYEVIVNDANGCTDQVSFSIDSPEPYYLTATTSNAVDCQVANSGRIEVTTVGGEEPFVFKWDHGPTVPILENLIPGTYTVNVTDRNGCVASETYELLEQLPLTVSVSNTEEITCGTRGVKTTFFVDVSGGFPPYGINWSAGTEEENGAIMITSTPGEYVVQISDSEGCRINSSVVVNPSPLAVDFDYLSSSSLAYNSNLVNYSIQFTPSTIGDVIAYEWNFGDGETSQEERPSHTFNQEGVYPVTLTITDIYGCQLSQVYDIVIEEAFILMPNGFTPNANGMNDHYFPRFNYITELELWIFNKWGETIYHIADRNGPGWDGTFRGEVAPAGNYVYKLRYTTPDGRIKDETNVFVLIR